MKQNGSGSRRSAERPHGQRLVALFCAAFLLFDFPLLALWDREATVMGVPLFPVALFTIWAVLIGLLAWVVEKAD